MKKQPKNFSIIDEGLTINGTLSSRGQMIIKGTVEGVLEGDVVIVAKEGTLRADTKVSNITIGGVFEGELTVAKELIILSTGSCSGRVTCHDLLVEAGGIMNADVSCLKQKVEVPIAPKNTIKVKGLPKLKD